METLIRVFAAGIRTAVILTAGVAFLLAHSAVARAELNELRIAKQTGIGSLPLIIMEKYRLVEKHAVAQGIGDLKVTWSTLGGGAAMNDALLSGNLHFALAGIPPFLVLWDKTKGNANVQVAAGFNNIPVFLNTTNPQVKTIKDFTANDKIALPAVKVSLQAIVLQMAAAQAWGQDNYAKLDSLTVSMQHPDAMIALLSGRSEVTAHFTSPPFMFQELEDPRVRLVLNSADLVGPTNFNVVYTTSSFRESNPKLFKAYLAALEEAMEVINADKKAATQIYMEATKANPQTFDLMHKIVTDHRLKFTTVPLGLMKFADFMHQVGTLKNKPASWQELVFPEVRGKPGS